MLVPKLRFKEFKNEWKKYRIGDTLKVKSGRDQKLVECINGKYPILGTGGQIGTTNSFLYDKPSVLIGRKGTIDKPQYMTIPFWTVDTLFYTDIKNGFNTKYIFYAFQNINWKKYDESTGVPSLSCKTIEEISYYIPNNDEQEKIAKFLTLLDKKIDLQKQKIEALKIYKKGLMNYLFKNSSNTYKVCLKNICIIRKGQQLNKENMSLLGNYYVLNGGSELSGYTNNFNVQENTITISEGGNSCGFVNFNFEKFWAGGHCYILDNISQDVNIYYLYHLLKHNQERIMHLRVGSGLPNIQKKSLENFELSIHNLQSQHYIYKILNSLDSKIDLEINKIKRLNLIKKSLLQQMFI